MANQTQPKIMIGFNVRFTPTEVTKVAIDHAKAFKAKLYVVSSVVGHQLNGQGELADKSAKQRKSRLIKRLEDAGIDYEMHSLVLERSPGEDLVEFAKKNNVDEIVVGFKVRSVIGEIIFGSNYRNLIADAPCPVVTVHVREPDE